jgi:hypothetical protein
LNAENPGTEAPPAPPRNPFGQVFGSEIPGAIPQAAGQPPVPQMGSDAEGTFTRADRKVGRNELCPCGSGKKFKHCHGTL